MMTSFPEGHYYFLERTLMQKHSSSNDHHYMSPDLGFHTFLSEKEAGFLEETVKFSTKASPG